MDHIKDDKQCQIHEFYKNVRGHLYLSSHGFEI